MLLGLTYDFDMGMTTETSVSCKNIFAVRGASKREQMRKRFSVLAEHFHSFGATSARRDTCKVKC